jgi:uncharacterized protein YdeI (YjbR/CyaY-like superfamily)
MEAKRTPFYRSSGAQAYDVKTKAEQLSWQNRVFSDFGKRPETMKVPYANRWQKETDKLRQIALDCGLTDEVKWGKPCFTFQKKNIAIVIPLKQSCAFSFFKGALLKHPKHILKTIGHQQAGRWIKFTSIREIAALRSILKDYLYEAIELEKSGTRVKLKKVSEYPVPEELQRMLDENEEVIHLPRLICEAGKNQSSAGGKVRANDPEWAWVQ